MIETLMCLHYRPKQTCVEIIIRLIFFISFFFFFFFLICSNGYSGDRDDRTKCIKSNEERTPWAGEMDPENHPNKQWIAIPIIGYLAQHDTKILTTVMKWAGRTVVVRNVTMFESLTCKRGLFLVVAEIKATYWSGSSGNNIKNYNFFF